MILLDGKLLKYVIMKGKTFYAIPGVDDSITAPSSQAENSLF